MSVTTTLREPVVWSHASGACTFGHSHCCGYMGSFGVFEVENGSEAVAWFAVCADRGPSRNSQLGCAYWTSALCRYRASAPVTVVPGSSRTSRRFGTIVNDFTAWAPTARFTAVWAAAETPPWNR